MELYSHSEYKGYHLFVEYYASYGLEKVNLYKGVAQFNGTTMFTSKSYFSGEGAEVLLFKKIDKYLE